MRLQYLRPLQNISINFEMGAGCGLGWKIAGCVQNNLRNVGGSLVRILSYARDSHGKSHISSPLSPLEDYSVYMSNLER
jgi:hypothetical protein